MIHGLEVDEPDVLGLGLPSVFVIFHLEQDVVEPGVSVTDGGEDGGVLEGWPNVEGDLLHGFGLGVGHQAVNVILRLTCDRITKKCL